MKKIIFGVYGDEINAQNINGIELVKRISSVYECHMFYYKNKPTIQGVIFHKTTKNKIIKNIVKLFVYIFCKFDLYYLPRVEQTDIFFAKHFGKRRCIISSIEIENAIYKENYKRYFCNYVYDFFSINNALKQSVKDNWNKNVDVLYLGYNDCGLLTKIRNKVETIGFIGTLYDRKKPQYVLEIAKRFPKIKFVIIGDGELKKELQERILKEKIDNVNMLGKIPNKEVYRELLSIDLLIITSDNEGQPKVSLEAGSLGVPTCYIKNSYSIDYIIDNKTGFEAKDLNDMIEVINRILNSNIISTVSKNILDKTKKYNWDILKDDYIIYFDNIMKKWNER